ncbi:MAG: J domain-containing protein [bacterium]|nr:J domain-containing protein [bacterium]
MRLRRRFDRLEALGVLGLGPGASGGQIKRAYRRLALRYHPDRHRAGRDEAEAAWCRARFREIGEAFAVLKLTMAADRTGQRLEHCARCGDLEPVWGGLDGNAYCRTCILTARGKRVLPEPPEVLVRCGVASAILIGTVACLVAWLWTEHQAYWWLTIGGCTATILSLLLICMIAPGAALPGRQRPRTRRQHDRYWVVVRSTGDATGRRARGQANKTCLVR